MSEPMSDHGAEEVELNSSATNYNAGDEANDAGEFNVQVTLESDDGEPEGESHVRPSTHRHGGDSSAADADAAAHQSENHQPRRVILTQRQFIQLLHNSGLGGLFPSAGGTSLRGRHDEESRRSKSPRPKYVWPTFEQGRKLMHTGPFGISDKEARPAELGSDLSWRIYQRELALGSSGHRKTRNPAMAQSMVPKTRADMIINYNNRAYSGQFSLDGNKFYSCDQGFNVYIYDTSNPNAWRFEKRATYHSGSWTITDSVMSPDNSFLAYSSIRSVVCIARTDPADDSDAEMCDFTYGGRRRGEGAFGIWSIRYSGDGREIVAGASDGNIYVYDVERGASILRIPGHDDDVNAVCYGDKASPHILYSGSDDSTVRVWDRRSLGDGRAAGVFVGHTEGLTYVDSKGDGRYVLSNSKDQTMKLWDLRKMSPSTLLDDFDPRTYLSGFDYRWGSYDESERQQNPHDTSVVTFRGHQVFKTLIRCHFSPSVSSGGRYVYSGSSDGCVYVWNLDGTSAGTIDVHAATKHTRSPADAVFASRWHGGGSTGRWKTIVRDCSWHPDAPIIVATAWNGWGDGMGTCSVHNWAVESEGDDEYERSRGRVDPLLRSQDRFWPEEGTRFQPPEGGQYRGGFGEDDDYYDDDEDDDDEEYEDATGRQLGEDDEDDEDDDDDEYSDVDEEDDLDMEEVQDDFADVWEEMVGP